MSNLYEDVELDYGEDQVDFITTTTSHELDLHDFSDATDTSRQNSVSVPLDKGGLRDSNERSDKNGLSVTGKSKEINKVKESHDKNSKEQSTREAKEPQSLQRISQNDLNKPLNNRRKKSGDRENSRDRNNRHSNRRDRDRRDSNRDRDRSRDGPGSNSRYRLSAPRHPLNSRENSGSRASSPFTIYDRKDDRTGSHFASHMKGIANKRKISDDDRISPLSLRSRSPDTPPPLPSSSSNKTYSSYSHKSYGFDQQMQFSGGGMTTRPPPVGASTSSHHLSMGRKGLERSDRDRIPGSRNYPPKKRAKGEKIPSNINYNDIKEQIRMDEQKHEKLLSELTEQPSISLQPKSSSLTLVNGHGNTGASTESTGISKLDLTNFKLKISSLENENIHKDKKIKELTEKLKKAEEGCKILIKTGWEEVEALRSKMKKAAENQLKYKQAMQSMEETKQNNGIKTEQQAIIAIERKENHKNKQIITAQEQIIKEQAKEINDLKLDIEQLKLERSDSSINSLPPIPLPPPMPFLNAPKASGLDWKKESSEKTGEDNLKMKPKQSILTFTKEVESISIVRETNKIIKKDISCQINDDQPVTSPKKLIANSTNTEATINFKPEKENPEEHDGLFDDLEESSDDGGIGTILSRPSSISFFEIFKDQEVPKSGFSKEYLKIKAKQLPVKPTTSNKSILVDIRTETLEKANQTKVIQKDKEPHKQDTSKNLIKSSKNKVRKSKKLLSRMDICPPSPPKPVKEEKKIKTKRKGNQCPLYVESSQSGRAILAPSTSSIKCKGKVISYHTICRPDPPRAPKEVEIKEKIVEVKVPVVEKVIEYKTKTVYRDPPKVARCNKSSEAILPVNEILGNIEKYARRRTSESSQTSTPKTWILNWHDITQSAAKKPSTRNQSYSISSANNNSFLSTEYLDASIISIPAAPKTSITFQNQSTLTDEVEIKEIDDSSAFDPSYLSFKDSKSLKFSFSLETTSLQKREESIPCLGKSFNNSSKIGKFLNLCEERKKKKRR